MWLVYDFLVVWIIAELISGASHWAEQRYGNPQWQHSNSWIKRKLYEFVVKDNVLHHQKPAAMLEGNFWNRNNSSIIPAFTLAAICAWFWPTYWPAYVGCIILGFANEIHGFAHLPKNKKGYIITLLQRIGLFQSPKQHKLHHTRPYMTNYCVVTNWMNPILDTIQFWRGLEFIVWLMFGIKPVKEREIF